MKLGIILDLSERLALYIEKLTNLRLTIDLSSEVRELLRCFCKPSKARAYFSEIRGVGFPFLVRGDIMAFQLRAGQSVDVTVAVVDRYGNPASVEDSVWSSNDESVMFVTPDTGNPLRANVKSVGPAGEAVLKFEADADFDPGEVNILMAVETIFVVAGEARMFNFQFGTPVDAPEPPAEEPPAEEPPAEEPPAEEPPAEEPPVEEPPAEEPPAEEPPAEEPPAEEPPAEEPPTEEPPASPFGI